MRLDDDLLALLRRPSTCYLATTMPDGSPQVTQTWVDTDGEHLLINSVRTHVKTRNIERDPRVAVAIAETLARKYLGGPYPWFGGRDQVRVVFVIAPESVTWMG